METFPFLQSPDITFRQYNCSDASDFSLEGEYYSFPLLQLKIQIGEIVEVKAGGFIDPDQERRLSLFIKDHLNKSIVKAGIRDQIIDSLRSGESFVSLLDSEIFFDQSSLLVSNDFAELQRKGVEFVELGELEGRELIEKSLTMIKSWVARMLDFRINAIIINYLNTLPAEVGDLNTTKTAKLTKFICKRTNDLKVMETIGRHFQDHGLIDNDKDTLKRFLAVFDPALPVSPVNWKGNQNLLAKFIQVLPERYIPSAISKYHIASKNFLVRKVPKKGIELHNSASKNNPTLKKFVLELKSIFGET